MNLDNLFQQIVLLSITASILAIAIIVVKNIFRKKLSGKIHYYIWFLLVLKLIIPLNLQSQLSPFNFINDKSQKYDISSAVNKNLSNISSLNTNTNNHKQSSASTDNYKPTITSSTRLGFNLKTAALIWIIGVLLILSYIILVNIILWINIEKRPNCRRTDVENILQESKFKLGINSKISIIYDEDVKSPAVYGIIRPKILISQRIIDGLSSQKLKFVFLHELAHIKRKDLILNVGIMLLQVIYWFNPLIVYSLYEFKQDCELACDATAINALNSNEIRDYGETIIDMLQMLSKSNLFIGTLGFSNKYSKRRIIMISSFNKKSIAGTAIALCLVFAVGCSSTVNTLGNNSNGITTNNSTPVSNTTKSSQSSTKNHSDITSKIKNYILNGQGNKPETLKYKWSTAFLNRVDTEKLYKQYISNGGKANDLDNFAKYITLNAPIPSDWKELFQKDLSDPPLVKVSKLEALGNDLYQVYIVLNGKEVHYLVVSSRTGYYYGTGIF